MSLINQIQKGLNAAFTAQLAGYKRNNTAVNDQLIWDGATEKTVQAETWYRWVNTNKGWGFPKYQTGTIPKSPVSTEDIAKALATFTKTLQDQRTKITGFEMGSDDTQYLYLNVVDGEKVKVIELKLSIRPHVAVQTATIYHFDDEAEETVQSQYQPTLNFEGKPNATQITVKRLKKSEQGLVKDVVNLQVALLNQKAIGFEEEAYVAAVVKVEEQRDTSPTTSTEEQPIVVQTQEQQADAHANSNSAAATTVVVQAEEHARELQEHANQAAAAEEERFKRETSVKNAAIAAAQAAYDAVLAQYTEAEQSMKDTAAAFKEAEKELKTATEQLSKSTPASAQTRLQHFSAQNKTQVRLLKVATLTLCLAAIITIAALKIIDAKLILGIFAAALLIPSIMFLPFFSFKKPDPVSTINRFQGAYDSALTNKTNAENALVKENAFEAPLAAARKALDTANAIVVAPLTVVTAVVEEPLTVVTAVVKADEVDDEPSNTPPPSVATARPVTFKRQTSFNDKDNMNIFSSTELKKIFGQQKLDENGNKIYLKKENSYKGKSYTVTQPDVDDADLTKIFEMKKFYIK